ncbi:MAG: hypothetical protein ABW098_05740 [Candidatus Thiodiazotropha sp.]
MKLDEVKNSGDSYEQDCDAPLKGSPIIIILTVVILAFFLMAFASTITKAASTSETGGEPKSRSIEKWQPPVAQKVVLPPMVNGEQAKAIADKWGVKLVSLRLTAGGYMIDFRFRVLDVEKSSTFFDHRIKPQLVVERSNAKLPVPMASKVGAFRTTNRGQNIRSNKTYYMVFGNPDAHVKSGEKVTMVIGDFKAEHLIVH